RLPRTRTKSVWTSRLSPRKSRAPRTPPGVRIYAIGDVHGRADLLAQLLATIDADVTAYPVRHAIEVLLGDYIDRGPRSREVLDILVARIRDHRTICLKGNHETYVPDFVRNPASLEQWRHLGGLETLVSYGMTPSINADPHEQHVLAAAFDRAL